MDKPFRQQGLDGAYMSAEWSRQFYQYLLQLVDLLKKKGFSYDQFALYPIDEPSLDPRRGDSLYLDLCSLIKLIDPRIKLFVNPCYEEPAPVDVALACMIYDIICPGTPYLEFHGNSEAYLATGKEIWHYFIGAPKHSSPLRYYRKKVWETWDMGFVGIGFWAYSHTEQGNFDDPWVSAWDPFDNRPTWPEDCTMVYGSSDGPVTSRRWDCWREGVEDYEYLWMLRDAIKQAEKNGVKGKVVTNAQSVLDGAPSAFLNACSEVDGDPKASAELARCRKEIQDAILALK